MLIQLLVSLSDPKLRERACGIDNDDVRVVTVSPREAKPSDAVQQIAPDVLLVDRSWLGPDPEKRIREVRSGERLPGIIYVAVDENPDERAALLAQGCLAVVDGRAGEPDFERAVLGVVTRWRDTAVELIDSKQYRAVLRLGDFVTASPTMRKLMETARRVSDAQTSLLILGETGVGKEQLAYAIHSHGPRRDHPMVVVNCAAIPETLLESELFGHERGSFTGAERTHRGYFEQAHGGTILLDEIGEMPVHLQVKLLRVLQERSIKRIGGEQAIAVDVRVIAATNRDLQEEMSAKRFRPDLYYRLGVVTLTIPPLRERKEDIALLIDAYLERYKEELGSSVRGVSPEAMRALESYHWPGNAREVVNVIERAVLLSERDTISLDDLPEGIADAFLPEAIAQLADKAAEPASSLDPDWFRLPLRDARQAWNAAFEKLYLERILRDVRGRVGEAAAQMGMDPRSLYTKMKTYGIRKEDFKVGPDEG